MASLLSELERFEQEMKDLGSEPSSSLLPPPPPHAFAARVPLPPPPPPPRLSTPLAAPPNSNGRLLRPPPESPSSVRPLPPSPLIAQGANSTTLPPPPAIGASTLPIRPGSQYSYSQPRTSFVSSPVVPPPSSSVKSVPVSQSSGSYFPVPFHLQQAPQAYQQSPQYQQSYQQGPVQYTSAAQLQSPAAQPAVVQAAPQPTHQYQAGYQPAAAAAAAPPTPTTQAPATLAPEIFAMPQQQQAQQLFQRDAQTITPEALESVKAALASGEGEHKSEARKKAVPRKAAGHSWEDPTLADWPENDHRLFCGDLGNEVNDEVLTKAFTRFPSFNMARVVRDKRTGKTKGYGFVSFCNPSDLAFAFKEMNGKYVGNRPIKLRKSTWKERTDQDALERHKGSKRQKSKKTLHK